LAVADSLVLAAEAVVAPHGLGGALLADSLVLAAVAQGIALLHLPIHLLLDTLTMAVVPLEVVCLT
jgi:hypothetical protein